MPILPDVIARARHAQNMTRDDLAMMSRVPSATIRNWEQGKRVNPRVDEVLLVCGVLGLRLGQVLQHPDRDTPWLALESQQR